MPHDESFIHRNRAVKASNGLFNNDNYRIISTNRYENFEVHEISSNTTVDITNSNYHRNFRQITLINFREITEFSADSQQFLANHPQPKIETNSAPREILISVIAYQRGSDGRNSVVTLSLVRLGLLVLQVQT